MARLDEIPGIGPTAAAVIIAEIGTGHDPVPHPRAPGLLGEVRPRRQASPPGKNKGNGATGHGNRYLARVLGEAAVGAGRTDTFLGERYRRIARRRGKKKAIVAVGRSILVIIWHLLSDPDAHFHDLGPDYYDHRINTDAPNAQPHPPTRSPRLPASPSNPPPDGPVRTQASAGWDHFRISDAQLHPSGAQTDRSRQPTTRGCLVR